MHTKALLVQEGGRAKGNKFMLKPQQFMVKEPGDMFRADTEELVIAKLSYGFDEAGVNNPAIFYRGGTFGKIAALHGLCRKEAVQGLYPGGVFCETDILLLSFYISKINPIYRYYTFVQTVPFKFRKAGGIVDVRQCKSAYTPLCRLFNELGGGEYAVAHAVKSMAVEEHGVAFEGSKLRFYTIK